MRDALPTLKGDDVCGSSFSGTVYARTHLRRATKEGRGQASWAGLSPSLLPSFPPSAAPSPALQFLTAVAADIPSHPIYTGGTCCM